MKFAVVGKCVAWLKRLARGTERATSLTVGDVVWVREYRFVRGLDGKMCPGNGTERGVVVWVAPNGDVGVRKESDVLRAIPPEAVPQVTKITPLRYGFGMEPVMVPWDVVKDGQFMVYARKDVAYAEGQQHHRDALQRCRFLMLAAIAENQGNDPRKMLAAMDAEDAKEKSRGEP